MLFDPDRHEPLLEFEWSDGRARDAIIAFAADAQAALRGDSGWPPHALDVEKAPPTGLKTLYLGASGMLWALWYLERQGAVTLITRPDQLIGRTYESYLAEPDTGTVLPSVFLGEAGILLVLWRLTGAASAADRLFTVIEENIPNPTNEALWGAPGTMVAAWHMFQWTGEDRWRELFVENVDQLWRTWLPRDDGVGRVWKQQMRERTTRYLGAGHGFAGNVYALLVGSSLLPEETRTELHERCVETLRATVEVEGNAANWPRLVDPPTRPGQPRMLVQWCHGAPGIVTALADFPPNVSPEMDDLLIKAGNAVWAAGPLTKGFGLCHGTAGNGYAFLALHRRTGDPIWLDRARAFAMHAMRQRERMREQHGRGRYTLWTGDAGLAVYLWHCATGGFGMPGLDIFD